MPSPRLETFAPAGFTELVSVVVAYPLGGGGIDNVRVVVPPAVPALGDSALAALTGLLAAVGARRLGRRRRG